MDHGKCGALENLAVLIRSHALVKRFRLKCLWFWDECRLKPFEVLGEDVWHACHETVT